MKLVHIITGMQKAAGTTTFVENVVEGLRAQGNEVEIVMSTDKLNHCDIMHIHGLWSSLLHKAAQYARRNNIPVVWSTHGMTAPWSMRHKWWKKVPAWVLYQKRDLRSAAAIHCTTEMEVEWNKSLGFRNCFITPLGTRLPSQHQASTSNHRHSTTNTRTLLFVGRIYPVKGLMNLIKAWGMVKACRREEVKDWKLRIVGPDQAGHRAELEKLVRDLDLNDSIKFPGPKFGDELEDEYEKCDCLVLPSFTENFGATIVDALSHGKPCIASTYTPWQELSSRGCGWWVSNEPAKLASAIGEMIVMPNAERREMGERGRRLVEEKYTWDAVVMEMVKGYEGLVKGEIPIG